MGFLVPTFIGLFSLSFSLPSFTIHWDPFGCPISENRRGTPGLALQWLLVADKNMELRGASLFVIVALTACGLEFLCMA